MTLLEQATDFQTKASGPEIMDAVDTYYAEDITIVEGTGETFHGRDTQKGRIGEWMASVEEIHGGEISAIAANETAPGTGVVFVRVLHGCHLQRRRSHHLRGGCCPAVD